MADKKKFFIHEPVFSDTESEHAYKERSLKAFESLPETRKKMESLPAGASLEDRFRAIAEVSQTLEQNGKIAKEYSQHVVFCCAETISEEKIMTSDNLNEISEKVNELENSYGLKDDEYFSPNDAPDEVRKLQIEWDNVCDSIIAKTLEELGELELAHLLVNDKDELNRILDIGLDKQREHIAE